MLSSVLEQAVRTKSNVLVIGPLVDVRLAVLERLHALAPHPPNAFLVDPLNRLKRAADIPLDSIAGQRSGLMTLREVLRGSPTVVTVVEPTEDTFPALFAASEMGTQVLSTVQGTDAAKGFRRYLEVVVSAYGVPRPLVLEAFSNRPYVVVDALSSGTIGGAWKAHYQSGEVQLTAL